MQSPRGHAPISEVVGAAGVVLPSKAAGAVVPRTSSSLGMITSQTYDAVSLGVDAETRSRRRQSLAKVRASATWSGKIDLEVLHELGPFSSDAQTNFVSFLEMADDDEKRWMAKREESLERLKDKKIARRGCGSVNNATVRRESLDSAGTLVAMEGVIEESNNNNTPEDGDTVVLFEEVSRLEVC